MGEKIENKIKEESQEYPDEQFEDNEFLVKSDFPEDDLSIADFNRKKPISKKIILSVLILLALALIVLGAFFLYKKVILEKFKKTPEVSITSLNGVNTQKEDTVVSEVEMEDKKEKISENKESVESKEKVEEINKNIEIFALNGGGGTGVAGKMKAVLVEAGYEKVTAKNASTFEYEGVNIFYSEDEFKDDAEALLKIIEKNYSNVSLKKSATIDEKSSEIVVIVGK